MTIKQDGAQSPVVLITGANSGIGYYMLKALAEQSYRVVGLDVQVDRLAELAEEEPDIGFLYIRCDVTDRTAVSNAVQAIIRQWDRIDVLVNNACVCQFGPFEERTIDDIREEFEVNVFGYLHMIEAVLPQMKKQGSGIIHNVSSGVGLTGFGGLSGYTASKGAVESLTRTLAYELAPHGIAVNVMHPPLTLTPSSAPLGIPAQVMASPEQVGRQLANRILSVKPTIAANWSTRLYLFFARRYPTAMGKLFTRLAKRGRVQEQEYSNQV